MVDQVPVQQQGVPPVAPQPAAPVPAQTAATPQAPMPTASAQPPAQPESVEELKKRLTQQEEQTRRLASIQAAKDRELYQKQQQWEAERARILQEMQAKQLAEMPDEDRVQAQLKMLQEENARLQQDRANIEWRSYLTGLAQEYATQGVPYDFVVQQAQSAQTPDQAAQMMHAAAANWWRNKYMESHGQAPPPPPQQPQPMMQPAPQYQVPQAPPVAAPHPTAYAAAAPMSSIDEQLAALREQTKASRRSTVEEALALMNEKWKRGE